MELSQLIKPFWEGNTVLYETILPLAEDGHAADARLFFKPDKIISVMSSDMTHEYIEGTDWKLKDDRICKIAGSSMPELSENDLIFADNRPGECFAAKNGMYVAYKTEGWYHTQQLLVTYTHTDTYTPDLGLYGGDRLKRTKEALMRQEPLKLCFYGDSITTGLDSSGSVNRPPFMPDWTKLITMSLEQEYHCEINYVNTAVSGKTSEWGIEYVKERLADHHPSIAVIAFGMNDGTEHISPKRFKDNILHIMNTTLEHSKDCEFILISPTLANPDSIFDGLQREYYATLTECARNCDAVINMTALHDEFLKRKRFCDTTGNNINHPSDFLTRVYAQAILKAFI